jgi:hypothetical protein
VRGGASGRRTFSMRPERALWSGKASRRTARAAQKGWKSVGARSKRERRVAGHVLGDTNVPTDVMIGWCSRRRTEPFFFQRVAGASPAILHTPGQSTGRDRRF